MSPLWIVEGTESSGGLPSSLAEGIVKDFLTTLEIAPVLAHPCCCWFKASSNCYIFWLYLAV
jgi:hypothetical protein